MRLIVLRIKKDSKACKLFIQRVIHQLRGLPYRWRGGNSAKNLNFYTGAFRRGSLQKKYCFK
jgi:hypothetical protein